MISYIYKMIGTSMATLIVWSNAVTAVSAIPSTAATTVTPPYSCPAVYDAIIAMKEDYPEGMSWTNDNFYAWNGDGMYSGGYGCVAYAYLISDAAFGTLPADEPLDYDPSLLRVGDLIRYDGHTILVLEVQSDAFIVTEGNYNSSVHWGRRVTFSSLEGYVDYYSSRYPEVFAFRENAAAIEIGATVTPAVISRDAVDLTWKTSDATIATVDANGLITGKSNGIAVVTAECGDVSESFTVTVGDPDAVTEKIPDGLEYRITDDETVTITGYTGTAADLTIPSTIEGLPVTTIGSWAFNAASDAVNMILPDTLTTIESFAFFDATKLETIVLPDSLEVIGSWVFYRSGLHSLCIPENVSAIGNWACCGMPNLPEINVAEENSYYCSVEGVLYDKNVKTLVAYPAGNTALDYSVCDGVTTIAPGAFGDVQNLQTLNIPASVNSITESTFELATALYYIHVDATNTTYCDIDGVLYTADHKTLLAYPIARTDLVYTIAPTTEVIAASAFAYCTALEEISFPETLLSINQYAFIGCSGLNEIKLPPSTTEIQRWAFQSCENLSSCQILYNVTTIGVDVFTNCADDFVIYGVEDSYAQTYAEDNGISFVIATVPVGDINGDYCVTIADVILLHRVIAEDVTLDIASLYWGKMDCNGDALIDLNDAVWILQLLADLG